MSALWARIQNLGNMSFLLRMMADTIRLLSDTQQREGSYVSPATRVAVQVEESADALDHLLTKEIENLKAAGGDGASNLQ